MERFPPLTGLVVLCLCLITLKAEHQTGSILRHSGM